MKSFGFLGEEFHPFRRGRWSDQADVGEMRVFGEFGGEFRFIGREVEEEDSVRTGFDGVILEFCEAIGEDRIQIGEEHDGSLLIGFTKCPDEIQRAGGGHAGF